MNESMEQIQESVELQEDVESAADLSEEEVSSQDLESFDDGSRTLDDIYDLLSRNTESTVEVLEESFIDYQLDSSLSDIGLIGFGVLCFIFFLGLFSFKGVS